MQDASGQGVRKRWHVVAARLGALLGAGGLLSLVGWGTALAQTGGPISRSSGERPAAVAPKTSVRPSRAAPSRSPRVAPSGRSPNGASGGGAGVAPGVAPGRVPGVAPMRPPARVPAGSAQEGIGFFGQVGTGFSYLRETFFRPGSGGKDCSISSGTGRNCLNPELNTLLFNALFGIRTRNSSDFFLMAYYRYNIFWDVVGVNAASFGNWFKSPRDPKSPLPTRGFLRVHEVLTDMRYIAGDTFRYGLQLQLSIGRVNTSLFSQQFETVRTSFMSEAAVPYVIFVGGRYYRARFYVPINTVVNHEDEELTFTTFDLNKKGRGVVFSAGLTNMFYIPQAHSLASFDLSYMDYKFNKVSFDRTRWGGAAAWNWTPDYFYGGTLSPKFAYFRENYYLPTAVIPGFDPDARSPNLNPAEKKYRNDNILRFGGEAALDVDTGLAAAGLIRPKASQHRLSFEAGYQSRSSTLTDYTSRSLFFVLRYLWTSPSTAEVGRFLRTTQRNPLEASFEGDGGQ